MGVYVDVSRTYIRGEEMLEDGDNFVFQFVHLFLNEDHMETMDAPGTPFTTAVGVLNGRTYQHRPWLNGERIF